jgi:hypothetical protein
MPTEVEWKPDFVAQQVIIDTFHRAANDKRMGDVLSALTGILVKIIDERCDDDASARDALAVIVNDVRERIKQRRSGGQQ